MTSLGMKAMHFKDTHGQHTSTSQQKEQKLKRRNWFFS